MVPPDKSQYNPLELVPNASKEVQCPDCGQLVSLGLVGFPNFYKRHQNSKTCQKNKEKSTQREKSEGWKTKAREATRAFFAPRSKTVAPTVKSPPIIPATAATSSRPASTPGGLAPTKPKGKEKALPQDTTILDGLLARILSLPNEVPEADLSHPLAQFAGDYEGCIGPGEDAWEVFDPQLNCVLQTSPEQMRELVRRGPYGLLALHRLLTYLVVEHGVASALIEGKVERVMRAIDEIVSQYSSPATSSTSQEGAASSNPPPTPLAGPSSSLSLALPFPESNSEPTPIPAPISPTPTEIIEVDNTDSSSIELARPGCTGILVETPPGLSIHRAYPYGIHDEYGDPWNYVVENGQMTLYARGCLRSLSGGGRCKECEALTKSTLLAGVLNRMRDGIHEHTKLSFHSIGSLTAIVKRKTLQNDQLRLRRLNDARKLARQASTLDEHKKWIMAIASGKVERVERLVRAGVKARLGIRGLMRKYNKYTKPFYKTTTYTEEERLQGLVFLRMGGSHVAGVAHRALALPSVSTLRRMALIPAIVASPHRPTVSEVEKNALACFGPIQDEAKKLTVIHQVLMIDELKVEERPRWDDKTNMILGICREHSDQASLEFTSEHEVQSLMEDVLNGTVHLAVEATVGALGLLSAETRLYSARPVLVSGSCKRESGQEHAEIIRAALEGSKKSGFRTVCISSDGESRRGEALILETFKFELRSSSPIYIHLSDLQYLNLQVGEDDITADKDQKHVIKRLRNLLLRTRGFKVHGVDITQGVLRSHMLDAGITLGKVNMKREAIRTMGSFFKHIVLPYICVDLTLTEQLTHLSVAAHMLLSMLREDRAGSKLMPTQLYVDIMIMIKNVYFCVAKAKVDNPSSQFFLILLGTDRLEELFGILRTMVGNDTNLDIFQLANRLTSTTEVSDILAKHPEWDRSPRRLKLPPLSKEGFDVHQHVDHIHPPTWRGNVDVASVNLKTCWRLGRQMLDRDYPQLSTVLRQLENGSTPQKIDILRPFGAEIVNAALSPEDIDDTREDFADDTPQDSPGIPNISQSSGSRSSAPNTMIGPPVGPSQALEDAVAEDEPAGSHDPCFELDGKKIYKARFLNQLFRDFKNPGSRDRLKRVANIPRYAIKKDGFADTAEVEIEPGAAVLAVDAPIATVLRCEGHYFLAIGEVNDIIRDGKHFTEIPLSDLSDPLVTISYQLLSLVPATQEDSPDGTYDWRWSLGRGNTYTVNAQLIEPVNPGVETRNEKAFYLFESQSLASLAALIHERITSSNNRSIPNVKRGTHFPYAEGSGKACFSCSDSSKDDETSVAHQCPAPGCTASLNDKTGQQVLGHIGAHIIFDSNIRAVNQPCGLCLRPAGSCHFYLRKGKGAAAGFQVDWSRTQCSLAVSFTYGPASASTESNPCSNVPIICQWCPSEGAAIWKYNMKAHVKEKHPHVLLRDHEHEWKVGVVEREGLEVIWNNRNKKKKTRGSKKGASLVISQAHTARNVLRSNIDLDYSAEVDANESEDDSDPEMGSVQRSSHSSVRRIISPPLSPVSTNVEDMAIDDPGEHPESLVQNQSMQRDLETTDIPMTNDLESRDAAVSEGEAESQLGGDSVAETSVTTTIGPVVPNPPPDTPSNATPTLDQANVPPPTVKASLPSSSRESCRAAENPFTIETKSSFGRRRRGRDLASELSLCTCGQAVTPGEIAAGTTVVKCRQSGCETKWYHLDCVGREYSTTMWTCEACESHGDNGKGAKRRRTLLGGA